MKLSQLSGAARAALLAVLKYREEHANADSTKKQNRAQQLLNAAQHELIAILSVEHHMTSGQDAE